MRRMRLWPAALALAAVLGCGGSTGRVSGVEFADMLGGGERSTRALGCPRPKRMFRFRLLRSNDLLWWLRGKASERLRHGGEVATAQCGS